MGLGLALRLAFALLPIDAHFMLLEDDAWMVTGIARHWALGHGITADGLNPTNGFHPLYPLTLGALPYLVVPDTLAGLNSGFRANLVLCALLNTLALLPLYGLARLVAQRAAALAVVAVIALNPFFIRVSVNAMETSLALLLLLTVWWYALARLEAHDMRGGALLGVLAGLAVLARLDNLVAAGMLGLVMLWREVASERTLPRVSLAYGTATWLLLLPYFARNVVQFGHATPSSGRALSYMHSYAEAFAFSSGLQLLAYQPALDLTWAPPWLLLAGTALLLVMGASITRAQQQALLPLLLYALVLTFYYAYLQQQGHPRYYVAVGVVVALLAGAWASRMADLLPPHAGWRDTTRWIAAAALLVVLANSALFALHVDRLRRAPYLAQPSMYRAARWIAANLPANARLAAQNSGVFQYYSERVVLNFDGKLNHEIIPVLEARALDVYLREQGVDYVVDLPGVAGYIEFYSAGLSEATPHAELSPLDKLTVYARLLAAKAGMGPPVVLDERTPTRVVVPFGDMARVVHREPLPNHPTEAVLVWRLSDEFGRVSR